MASGPAQRRPPLRPRRGPAPGQRPPPCTSPAPRRPRPSPAEVVRAQPPAALGVAGAAVTVLLRLVPVEARAAGPAGACAVLVAAVVGAVHLEALGQACTRTGGPEADPRPDLLPTLRGLSTAASTCSGPSRAGQSGSRRAGRVGSAALGPLSSPGLTWALQAPRRGSAWRQQPEQEEEEQGLGGPCPHRPQPKRSRPGPRKALGAPRVSQASEERGVAL